MKIFRWIAFVLVAFLVMGVMGAAAYKVYAQGSLDCDEDPSNPALPSQAGITREQAEAIARDQYSGSNALETELERECGTLLYEVELDNAAEVEVDANAGTVILTETGNSPTNDVRDAASNVTAPANTAITADEARKIAEEANPGATALEVDFEREGGIDMWEVELSNNLEVELDANTGAILSTEQD
ncbi:MAG TPA: PepSY domain-containing protein [Anaerolineales bacterium]|nr:PepSY domain-containing protein [Anaerolineales bacterium]